MRIRVAVDAMGGDLAPNEVILGALAAIDEEPDLEVLLVGDEARVRAAVDWGSPPRVHIVHAPEAIGMGEHPVEALKQKRQSSIAVAIGLVREGKADAFFSAGNTGACVAAASMALKRIEGVRRPGIAVVFPSGTGGATVLMDAGANIAPKAVDLLHYGAMAAAYARTVLGVAEPTIGLLNVGTEEDKGTELVQEAAKLLRASGLAYRGFVEGHDLFNGAADVVVCDGFVGNAVLKAFEGQVASVVARVRSSLEEVFKSELDRHKCGLAMHQLQSQLDWAESGGAPLLGVDGVVVIGHGRSEAKAIASGIKVAARAAGRDLRSAIVGAIAKLVGQAA